MRVRSVAAGGATARRGRTVRWTIATGGGTLLSATRARRGRRGDGRWVLGTTVGKQSVTVTVAGVNDALTFTATAQGGGSPAVPPLSSATVPVLPTKGSHDTFVRDGLASS